MRGVGVIKLRRCALLTASWLAIAVSAAGGEGTSTRASSWTEQAYNELGRGRNTEAISMFQNALKADPKSRNAWFGLATAYIQVKNYALAERVLLKLEQSYPQDVPVKNNLAWMYATAEDPNYRDSREAVTKAREAVFLSPGSPELWSTLCEAHYLAGDYEKAFRAAEHLVDLVPRDKLAREQARIYAEQYDKCKKAKEAMSLVEQPGGF